jgi:S-DNA-T family DNA segregation ATPase FtsK/SpoIIIE
MSKKPSKKSSAKSKVAQEERFSLISIFTFIFKDGRFKRIVGVCLLLLTIFLAVSLFSYIKTWKLDQDKVLNQQNTIEFLLNNKQIIDNKAGRLGAFTSHQLMYNGFGIMAFSLVLFFGIWGYNLLAKDKITSTLKTFFYTSLSLLLFSPVFSYLTQTSEFCYGGSFGNKVVHFLNGLAGNIGTPFILFGLATILLIALFNPIFQLPMWASLFTKNKEQTISSNQQNDEYENQQTEEAILNVYKHRDELEATENFKQNELTIEQDEDDIDKYLKQKDNKPQEEFSGELEINMNDNEVVFETKEEEVETHLPIEKNTTKEDALIDFEINEPEIVKTITDEKKMHIGIDEPYDPLLELRNYKYPTLDLLENRSDVGISIDKNELEQNKNQIIQTLKSFGITIAKISATVGPTVTLYEIVPAEGVRISKIRNLEDDIALSLAALGIRIIAPIPGKGTIGIEVPNINKQMVSMRSLLSSEKFINSTFSLPIALGKKIDNDNYIVDLAAMPHLLMAGATGQGKSVGINAILVSLLYKKHPSQLKFVMVDPKKVELSIYKMIEKHFLAKLPNEEEAIITDTKKVVNTLNALCIEMDNRYELLKNAGVRNIKEYNEKFTKRKLNPEKGHQYLPFIVLVVDEFADLIMTAGKEVEMPIARLAQLARAIGIHLIIATQRPSVNVITGTIKANFPARMAFRVSAKVDSRTILDTGGADQLIGRGDMLILNGNELVRLQCAFVDTPEVENIVNFIGNQQGYPTAFDLPEYEGADGDMSVTNKSQSLKDVDQMFEQCARLVVSSNSGSTSMLQRRFNLGYNRAGRIMDQLEAAGIVGASISGGKPRELMVHTESELDEILRQILK